MYIEQGGTTREKYEQIIDYDVSRGARTSCTSPGVSAGSDGGDAPQGVDRQTVDDGEMSARRADEAGAG